MRSIPQKQRIVLASTSEQENLILKRKLDPAVTDLGPIQFISVRPQGVHFTLDSAVSIVIVNLQSYNGMGRQAITESRKAGYTGPILVMAKIETPELLHEVKSLNDVLLLEKPFEQKDLQGVVRKLILARAVAQRIHRRFNTVQKAHIEIPGRGKSVTTLLNLSRGGAYVEFAKKTDLKKGDQLHMTIELNEINRNYAMPARVVWTTPVGMMGGHGVGVEFMGRIDVQNNPLGT